MTQSLNADTPAVLAKVLDNNIEAVDRVKSVASELDVVHTVLSTTIPQEALADDLQAAVERTDELEKKLQETADALKVSNKLLEAQVSKAASNR